jgi:hypothetical protein
MKPAEYQTGHYLEQTMQLHVPAYQRPYSWEEDRLIDLWRDVANQYRRVGRSGGTPKNHFMGALIIEQDHGKSTSGVTAVNVIDGQQRLLTMFVLLAAIRDHVHFLEKTPIKTDNDLFMIKPKFGTDAQRVFPKAQDQECLAAILQGKLLDEIDDDLYEHRLTQAYRFFRYQLWLGKESVQKHTLSRPPRPKRSKTAPPRGSYEPWGKHATGRRGLDLPELHTRVTGTLTLLELMLQESDEEAGVIFETMNAKSTPLRQFDLVRNSIFVRMPKTKDVFYVDVWEHVESALNRVTYASLREKPEDQFFYEYVISTGEAGVSKDSLHRRWLQAVIEDLGYEVTTRSEKEIRTKYVDPLAQAAFLYPIAVGQRKSVKSHVTDKTVTITEAAHATIGELMAMSGGPAVPLVLRALVDLAAGDLTMDDFEALLHDVQSYLVRLILANEDFSPLRSIMMGISSKLTQPVTLASLRSALNEADWKEDSEILAVVKEVDTKKWKSAALFPVLRGIERQLSGISAHPLPFGNKQNQFSIEHIYPQTSNIGHGWEADIAHWGVSRDDIDARRYTLGNLTAVTGYDNKRNGKKRFSDKQGLIAATADLKLHKSFSRGKRWTPDRIDARTETLAEAALKRWPKH